MVTTGVESHTGGQTVVPFSKANIGQMSAAMKRAAGDLLSQQQVDLYGAGTVEVKLHVSVKRSGEDDLTAGATQETGLVATIDADDWTAKAVRAPQKGDVIHWAGQRYAVRNVHLAAPAGVTVFFKAELDG